MIETTGGQRYDISVENDVTNGQAQEDIKWQHPNGTMVSAGDVLATGNDMRVTINNPPNSLISTSMFSDIVGQERRGFTVNVGSYPDGSQVTTDLAVNSPDILGITIGDDARIQVRPGVSGNGPLQFFAPGNFQPTNTSITSEQDPVLYVPEEGTVSVVGSDGQESLISPYTSGVEVSRVFSSVTATNQHNTTLQSEDGDLLILSSNPNPISVQRGARTNSSFAELRPLDGQINIPRGTGYAVIDTQGEQGIEISPALDGGNTMIGYSDGSADNSLIDVATGSELFLVSDADMDNFVNGGSYVSYPVNGGSVNIAGVEYPIESIQGGYFPVMSHSTSGQVGLAGAPFLELTQVAQNSIAGATRTAPTYTTRTYTTTTPGTTPSAGHGPRGGLSNHVICLMEK